MKAMTMILFLCISATVMASTEKEPGDDERLRNIGIGTKLEVIKDLNILPNNGHAPLGRSCYLTVVEIKNFARVLSVGKVLTVIKTASNKEDDDILIVDNNNIKESICLRTRGSIPTIGRFKDATQETFRITLANPVEI